MVWNFKFLTPYQMLECKLLELRWTGHVPNKGHLKNK